jgi:hypothetical protein
VTALADITDRSLHAAAVEAPYDSGATLKPGAITRTSNDTKV